MPSKEIDDYNKERKAFQKKEKTFPNCIDCGHIGRLYGKQKGYPFDGKKRIVIVWECGKHPCCFVTERSKGCEDWYPNPKRKERADLPPADW